MPVKKPLAASRLPWLLRMKKKSRFIAPLLTWLLLVSCTPAAGADVTKAPGLNLQTAWQSAAVFADPESVVFDPVSRILLVASGNGPVMERAGNGYLSKVALNGVVLDHTWLSGFHSPKGIALAADTLYVADISDLVVIDLTSGRRSTYPASAATSLRDVALDQQGRLYLSDTCSDTIYTFADGVMEVWLHSPRLAGPGALFVQDNSLYVGSRVRQSGGLEPKETGRLLAIDLHTKEIRAVGGGLPLVAVGGVAGLADRGFLITDRQQGRLLHLDVQGRVRERIDVGSGAAGLHVLPEDWELVVVPLARDNMLKAFHLPIR
mgnify:CR=1 FL=1